MKLPFGAKPPRLTDRDIREAMAELQALRAAVAAAEKAAGPAPHNDNVMSVGTEASALKSHGQGRTRS